MGQRGQGQAVGQRDRGRLWGRGSPWFAHEESGDSAGSGPGSVVAASSVCI